MRHVSVFSGIGGFDLAFKKVRSPPRHGTTVKSYLFVPQYYDPQLGSESVCVVLQAGHELILMCENDPGCQQVRSLYIAIVLRVNDPFSFHLLSIPFHML